MQGPHTEVTASNVIGDKTGFTVEIPFTQVLL